MIVAKSIVSYVNSMATEVFCSLWLSYGVLRENGRYNVVQLVNSNLQFIIASTPLLCHSKNHRVHSQDQKHCADFHLLFD